MVLITRTFPVSHFFASNLAKKPLFKVESKSLGGQESAGLSPDSVPVNVYSSVERKMNLGPLIDVKNGRLGKRVVRRKKNYSENLNALWDDGYGSKSIKDYLDLAKEMIKDGGGPPRWFIPDECGRPLKVHQFFCICRFLIDAGIDGLGLGLILHHKALGKVFEVKCLHIPVTDRTPFEDLVKFVEERVKLEHELSPSKPIYLVAESFGGSLALSVAARNPTIDLVLILANPATSFARSQLQPFFPIVEAIPDELYSMVPYLLSLSMGNPLKMAMVDVDRTVPLDTALEQLASHLSALLPRLSDLVEIIPKKSLAWKLKLLKCASSYANCRLHAVTAEVLVLASGNDNLLPSVDEANRLLQSLKNCEIRYFKDNGHTIFLEDGVNLLTIIKSASKYRRSKRYDFVDDFLPPSMSEYNQELLKYRLFLSATSPVTFSTTEDGKIVKGLSGVPNEGPVLLVGYHMLLGLEIVTLLTEFLREKKVAVRGMAHPELFTGLFEDPSDESLFVDGIRLWGAIPVTPGNLYKSLSSKSFTLLYPGGAREALHRKGEGYTLFWPDQPEFVRMAAKFGVTIVPFGAVGEDDICEVVLDYHDQMKIPVFNDFLKKLNENSNRLRKEADGEVANQAPHIPAVVPKVPGRLYLLFGKPIQTKGKEVILKDKKKAKELYLQIKHQVESNIAFLIKKREEDPYRSIIVRALYQATSNPLDPIPTFDP